MKTLGFIGTGGMGSGMAANLIKAGYSLVITDLRREVARNLESQGAVFKDSPKAVAEASEMVLSMLPYNEAVKQVGLGAGGLHEATKGAKLWVDFSSIDKKTIVGVDAELQKKGGPFSTAPQAESKKPPQQAPSPFGSRARRHYLINIKISLNQWAKRSCMSANWAMPSW